MTRTTLRNIVAAFVVANATIAIAPAHADPEPVLSSNFNSPGVGKLGSLHPEPLRPVANVTGAKGLKGMGGPVVPGAQPIEIPRPAPGVASTVRQGLGGPVVPGAQPIEIPRPIPGVASTVRQGLGGPVVPGAQPIEIPRPTPGTASTAQLMVRGPVVPGAQPIEIPRPTPGTAATAQLRLRGPVVPGAQPIEIPRPTPGIAATVQLRHSTNLVSALPVPLPDPASTKRGSMLVLRTTQSGVGGPVVPGAQPIEIPRPIPGATATALSIK